MPVIAIKSLNDPRIAPYRQLKERDLAATTATAVDDKLLRLRAGDLSETIRQLIVRNVDCSCDVARREFFWRTDVEQHEIRILPFHLLDELRGCDR